MGVLQRAGALLLINLALQVVERLGPDDGPNIGLGLAWFLLCLVVAGVWGRRDARGEMTVRAVVVLRYYLGMTVPDIAACLGIPLGTVKARLHRSIADIRPTVVRDVEHKVPMTERQAT